VFEQPVVLKCIVNMVNSNVFWICYCKYVPCSTGACFGGVNLDCDQVGGVVGGCFVCGQRDVDPLKLCSFVTSQHA